MSTASILIVNPNTNPSTTAMLVAAAEQSLAGSGLLVHGQTASSGPRMIIDEAALIAASASTVDAAMASIDRWRPHAVIIGAFGDPGIEELRARVGIPVVGIGHAAIVAAAKGRRRFAIATTTSALRSPLDALALRSGKAGEYVGAFFTATEPLALAAQPGRMVAELGDAVDAARGAGAQAVVIGGGPLSDSAKQLALRTDVAVVEPVPSAVAATLAQMRLREAKQAHL